MIEWFMSGGVVMWPLLVLALGVVGLGAREAVMLRRLDPRGASHRASPATILFWGAVSLLVGLLGTVVGIVIMARNVAAAGEVSGSLVWGGVGVSLVPLVFGILTFLVAAFLWLPLDTWRRRALGR